MPAAEQGDEQLVERLLVAYDYLGDRMADPCNGAGISGFVEASPWGRAGVWFT